MLIQDWSELFATRKPYAWPDQIEYRDPEHLIEILGKRGAKAFAISSSFGLSGFVLAESMEMQIRDSKVTMP